MFTRVFSPVSKFQVAPTFVVAKDPSIKEENISCEIGFWEFPNENELADELLASISSPVPADMAPEIDPEDFERTYQWFIS